MAENKTEKATPKKRKQARDKGQVARSQDVNGAVVLMASILALSAFGPSMLHRMQEATIGVLAWVSAPDVVDKEGVSQLFMTVGGHVDRRTRLRRPFGGLAHGLVAREVRQRRLHHGEEVPIRSRVEESHVRLVFE